MQGRYRGDLEVRLHRPSPCLLALALALSVTLTLTARLDALLAGLDALIVVLLLEPK